MSDTSETNKSEASSGAAPQILDDPQKTAMAMAELGLEKKALDITLLDIREHGSYADFIVVMSAESVPQMTAIADHIEASLKESGRRPMSVEGLRGGQWVLMDYGDVILHIFQTEAREFYDLEGLWADAKKTVGADGKNGQS